MSAILAPADMTDLPAPSGAKPAAVALRMAELLREKAGARDGATLDDLERAGFSTAEIVEYLPEAHALARKHLTVRR